MNKRRRWKAKARRTARARVSRGAVSAFWRRYGLVAVHTPAAWARLTADMLRIHAECRRSGAWE